MCANTLKYGGHVGGISHMSAHTPHGIEVCLKTLVVYIIKLHIFSNFWSGNIIQTVLERFRQEQHEFKQRV